MDDLRQICMTFRETQKIYNDFKEKNMSLREKCDSKLKEEIKFFATDMDEIAQCADILLDNFDSYGNAIRFPINISEDEKDCVVVCFSQRDYCISRSYDDVILYKSDVDVSEIPLELVEYLIVNKEVILSKTAEKVKAYLLGETSDMQKSMEAESAYYENLCGILFPDNLQSEEL